MNKLALLLPAALFLSCSCANLPDESEQKPSSSLNAAPSVDERLSGAEIIKVFADVRDDAEVQGAERTRAINLWFADGTFVSKWQGERSSGEQSGRWFVNKDERCVLILLRQGRPTSQTKCGPVYRRGKYYISRNANGSVHGIHSLTPLPAQSARP